MYNTKLQIKTFFVFTIFQKKNIKIREYTYVHAHEYTSSCFNEHRRGTKEREKQNKREEKTWKKEERRKREGREEDATTQFTMARHGAIYSPEAATFFRISTSGTVHDRSKHTHTLIYTHIGETFFQGVVSFPVVEVAAPSAGRKKDNGRKEWGSIS